MVILTEEKEHTDWGRRKVAEQNELSTLEYVAVVGVLVWSAVQQTALVRRTGRLSSTLQPMRACRQCEPRENRPNGIHDLIEMTIFCEIHTYMVRDVKIFAFPKRIVGSFHRRAETDVGANKTFFQEDLDVFSFRIQNECASTQFPKQT